MPAHACGDKRSWLRLARLVPARWACIIPPTAPFLLSPILGAQAELAREAVCHPRSVLYWGSRAISGAWARTTLFGAREPTRESALKRAAGENNGRYWPTRANIWLNITKLTVTLKPQLSRSVIVAAGRC